MHLDNCTCCRHSRFPETPSCLEAEALMDAFTELADLRGRAHNWRGEMLLLPPKPAMQIAPAT